ncbi:MAG: HdeD family acid-resistance protein [Dysgonomonas sp.]
MKNEILSSVKQAVKYWWVSLLVGILAVILGIWCAAAPSSTLIVLSALFTASFLVSGIAEIIFAVSNKDTISGWGWTLASGVIDLLFGFLLLAMPFESIFVLIFFVGFWVMFQSIWGIGAAVELQRNKISGWGWLLALAILGLILSFILIVNPVFASGFIVGLFSITLICYGILRIYYSFKLKSVGNDMNEIKKELEDK